MATLSWNPDERPYYTGVDQAVLYLSGQPGVSWSGVVSINEESGDVFQAANYIDGRRYNITQSAEDFDFKISAYTYPPEFDACCGYDEIYDNQPQLPFGLSYRTQSGSGYLLHLVYNATAKESNTTRNTLNNRTSAMLFNWDVSTKPKVHTLTAPSSHVIIDLTNIHPTVRDSVLDIVYGTASTDPRLPALTELVDLFISYAALVVVDNGDGTWTATGPPEAIQIIDSDTFDINWPSLVYLNSETFKLTDY